MKTLYKNLPLLIAVILILPMAIGIAANPDEEKIKSMMPEMLGANNVGNDFWVTIPPCYEDEAAGSPNFVKIFVTSPIKTLVNVEVPGKGIFKSQYTIPNDIIEFNLAPADGQPYLFSGRTNAPVAEAVYKGAGIHVFAEDPLVVYVMVRYHWSSDGFLAFPVSALGKEYICASYPDMVAMYSWAKAFPSMTGIVAAHDNTKVRFKLGGNIITQTAGGLKPGETTSKTLNKGDVWMFMSNGAEQDLSGSKISASKPVGVVSGVHCANIPTVNRWCDYIVEMDIPTYTWGTDVHAAIVTGRKFASLIRIFAKEDDTKVFRNGNQILYIPDGGGPIGRGYHEMRVVPMEQTPKSAVISGDKPIGITLYNPGVEEDGMPRPNSDPFMMGLTPLQQYQTEITFCTPGIRGGFGYPENYLNLVYETDEDGFVPEDMEFAEVKGGEFEWSKIRSRFSGLDEHFDYDIDGKHYAKKVITLPGDGVYKIRSNKPFAAYSYGYSDYDSYGYPTSAALADLEKPDTVAPDPVWEEICGNVEGALVTDRPDDAEIRSNLAKIVFHRDISFNYDFSYEPFVPGEDHTTTWSLMVQNPENDAKGVITFTDRRGNDTTITIEYFSPKFTIEPDAYDYGRLKVGDYMDQTFTLKNLSETGPIDIDLIKLQSGDQGFELLNVTTPVTLPPLGTYDFTVRFTATVKGEFRDSVGADHECLKKFISLVEAEVGSPVIEASDDGFGDVPVGDTRTKTLSVKNLGDTPLEITRRTTLTLEPVFTSPTLPYYDETNKLILQPDQSHQFEINFTPADEIYYQDSIIFSSDATEIDSVSVIDGRGIKADLIATSINWPKLRIDRPSFPVPAYDEAFGDNVWTLSNSGTQDVVINKININVVLGDENVFEFDRNYFNSLVVPKGETITIPVKFHPTSVGEHKIEITYDNTAGSDTKTTLYGAGKYPKIATFDMHFDTTIVDDYSAEVTKTIRFTNTSWTDALGFDVSDSLTITQLLVEPNGNEILTTAAGWADQAQRGTEGFKFNIEDLDHSSAGSTTLPVILMPDQYIEITARFVATHSFDHTADLTSVSDAEGDQTSTWTAYGLDQGLAMSGASSLLCVGEKETITCTVTNTGTGDITVESLELDPKIPSVNFVNPADANGFTLTTQDPQRTIGIEFSPATVLKENIKLVANSKIGQDPLVVDTDIDVESVYYTRTTSSNVTLKKMDIGQVTTYSIMLDNGDNLDLAQVQEFTIDFQYKKDFLVLNESTLQIGSLLFDKWDMTYEIIVIDEEEKIDEVRMIFKARDPNYLNGSGELVSMTFEAFLPWYAMDDDLSNDREDKVTFAYNIRTQGTMCLDISNSEVTVERNPVCVNDMRMVQISDTRYALNQINPNPVGSAGADLEFSLGLPGYTEIKIINSNGDVVSVPVSGQLGHGRYSIRLHVDGLSSGVYLVSLTSGQFTAQQKLVISK